MFSLFGTKTTFKEEYNKIIFQPEGSEHNRLETKLQLVLDPESFIALESIQEPEKCVGVEDNGSMKAAENCTTADNHAMFGVHLIVRSCHILCLIVAIFYHCMSNTCHIPFHWL